MVLPEQFEALKIFEETFHRDVVRWIVEKSTHGSRPIDVLDLSLDYGLFSSLVTAKIKDVKRFVVTVREDDAEPYSPTAEKKAACLANDGLSTLQTLGKFDLIIVKEVMHEAEDLGAFMEAIKGNLRDKESKVFLLTRPKNPPVPLPDNGMIKWRKMAPTREDLIEAADKAGYKQDTYSVSCPVKIDKAQWEHILRGRFLAALKRNEKCSDREIREFVRDKAGPTFAFEEKIMLLVLWLE